MAKLSAKKKKISKKVVAKKKVRLLSGGNPQIAKGDGNKPVQAYISALPSWKKPLVKQIDAIVESAVPKVTKAVKWNSPFYGIEGQGWFLSLHAYKNYIKIAFFKGSSLKPLPPGESKSPDVRYLDVWEKDTLDEAQLAKWLKQASKIPGWMS